MDSSSARIAAYAVAAYVTVFCLAWYGTPFLAQAQFDDSYITYRYALNLAAGHGLTFNAGDLADSASAFLYTLFLAAFVAIGLGPHLEVVAALVGLGATAAIAFRMVVVLVELWRQPTPASALAAAVCSTSSLISGWALQGMETPVFALLAFLSLEYCFLRRSTNPIRQSGLLLATALTRPEGILLTGLYVLDRMPWRAWRSFCSGQGLVRLLWTQRHGLSVLAVIVVFYGAKAFYYDGVWISQALQLKSMAVAYQPDPWFLLTQLRNHAGLWLAGGLITTVLMRRSIPWPLPTFIIVLGVVIVLGPREDHARYLTPLAPLTALIASFGWCRLITWHPIGGGLGSVLAAAMVVQAVNSATWMHDNFSRNAELQQCRAAAGRWLKDHLVASDLILSSDVGAVGYAAWPLPIVDMFGLTHRGVFDALVARRPRDHILLPHTTGFIADTFANRPEVPGDGTARLAPFHIGAGGYHVNTPSQLTWSLEVEPLFRCVPSSWPELAIEVRRVRWSKP